MSRVALYISNFVAGEFSPRLEGRTDIKKYPSACRTLENMHVHVHGGATRRPGTKFVRECKESALGNDSKVRLFPFSYNPECHYIIEAGDSYMRFYKNNGTVTSGGAPYEIATPYSDSELDEIKTCKMGTYLYFVHPDHAPYKLIRDADASMALSAVSFTSTPDTWTSGTYPRAVAYHEQRSWWATENRIWGSVSQLPEDLTTGVADDDGIVYDTPADMIYWMESGRKLMAGDWTAPWSLSSGSDDLAMTPTKVKVRSDSNDGCADIKPLKVGSVMLYLQRAKLKIRQLLYQFTEDSFNSDDISILSEHITSPGVADWDYQAEPDSIVWMTKYDGQLVGLTYDKSQEVIAYHLHKTGPEIEGSEYTKGLIESVAVIPNEGGNISDDLWDCPRDELWMVVKRTLPDDTEHRYIEYMMPDFGTDIVNAFYVDSGLTYDTHYDIIAMTSATPTLVTVDSSTAFTAGTRVKFTGLESSGVSVCNNNIYDVLSTVSSVAFYADCDLSSYTYDTGGVARYAVESVSGLDHLEGETVSVLVDGAPIADTVVSGGAIDVTEGAVIHAGLPYTSILEPMRIDGGAQDGTSQGKRKRIHDILIRFYKTLGANVGSDTDHMDVIAFRKPTDPMGSAPALFTGDKIFPYNGGWETNGYIRITQAQPLPMTVLSISPRTEVND